MVVSGLVGGLEYSRLKEGIPMRTLLVTIGSGIGKGTKTDRSVVVVGRGAR